MMRIAPLEQNRRFFSQFSELSLFVAALLMLALPLHADDQAANIETAPNSVGGIVNANDALVRSGATDTAYATMKLKKGDHVTVVGASKLGWLKIVPPEGSFCYVGKLFVDRHGDGTQGRINKDKVNIRAGSQLNAVVYAILCEAPEGTPVTILGEHDEYFKIKPPEGAFLYINQQFVDPEPKALTPASPLPIGPAAPRTPLVPMEPAAPVAPTPTPGSANLVDNTTATTQPSNLAEATGSSTTQPAATPQASEVLFAQAESNFNTTSAEPLEKQAIQPLLAAYQMLASNDTLPDSLRRVAEDRLVTLQARNAAIGKLAEIQKEKDALQHKNQALAAETQELQERVEKSGVAIYAAVGELHPSSLQIGTPTLYRLTDPANGRTICYLRSQDAKIISFDAKFVGVTGEVADDPQLQARVITAKDVVAVDPGKVNNGVIAGIVPPSLLPKGPSN